MRRFRRFRRVHIMLPQRWYVFWQRALRNRGLRILITAALTALAFVIVVLWIDHHLRPMVTQMAKVRVDHLASKAINGAIAARITADNVQYSNLVYFEKDIYGNITALKTDIVNINRLKADIIGEVLESLENIGVSELSIPLGNLINGEILSGRGPLIPVRIVPLGSVSAEFSNVFTSAGINQTRHQILMNITVDISVLLPGYSAETRVTAQVNVAETIIVGAVPESYTHFEDTAGIFSGGELYKSLVP